MKHFVRITLLTLALLGGLSAAASAAPSDVRTFWEELNKQGS